MRNHQTVGPWHIGVHRWNSRQHTLFNDYLLYYCCRNWHMGYDDGLVGATGNKMAREDSDADRK